MKGLIYKAGIKQQEAFALPTVLVLSLTLLILGLSSLQVGTSIARVLNDQNWNRLAQEAAQAGVSYASSCLQTAPAVATSTWKSTGLTPKTDCKGDNLSGVTSEYYAESPDGIVPKWKAKFAVSKITAASNAKPRASVVGTVELFSAANAVTKTYTASNSVIINVTTGGLKTKEVAKTDTHTCVLASDSQVYCAGDNQFGQLGCGGSSFCPSSTSTPVRFNIPAGKKAVQVYTNGAHWSAGSTTNGYTCVVTGEGSDTNARQMYCAGYNQRGQLGDGTTTNRSTPVRFNIAAGQNVIAAQLGGGGDSAGSAITTFTCAMVNPNGRIYCSGANNYGQLGCGAGCVGNSVATPQQEFAAPTSPNYIVKLITSPTADVCVMIQSMQVYCSGYNGSGTFGNTGTFNYSTPTQAFGGWGMYDFGMAANNACMLRTDGVLGCSGTNGSGQFGTGGAAQYNTPQVFQYSSGNAVGAIRQFSLSDSTVCAIDYSYKLWCSGLGSSGQQANGGTGNRVWAGNNSTGLPSFTAATRVFTSTDATCVLAEYLQQTPDSGKLSCVGKNAYGQFGTTTTSNAVTSFDATGFRLPSGVYVKDVFITTGTNPFSVTPTMQTSSQYKNTDVICALGTDDQAYCAGRNNYGQLGNPALGTGSGATPVKFDLAAATAG